MNIDGYLQYNTLAVWGKYISENNICSIPASSSVKSNTSSKGYQHRIIW